MQTEKQNWLETLRPDGTPERLVNQFAPTVLVTDEPIYRYLYGNRVRGSTSVDRFGTVFLFPADGPGPMPEVTEENKVIPDITRWEAYLKLPDLKGNCTDWAAARTLVAGIDRDQHLVMGMMLGGVFEELHFLMGLEDALCNLMIEPEATAALVQALGKFRLEYAALLIEHLRPDVILSHDDWGTKTGMFMQPDLWREIFKPHYAELYGFIKSKGVKVIHHADCFLEPIVPDMAEIGIDIWQGVLPSNDIPRLQRELGGRMTLMGGIDSGIVDAEGATEADIRAEARRACEAYGPGGHFIPSLTYGRGNSIHPHVYDLLSDEIARYNATHPLR